MACGGSGFIFDEMLWVSLLIVAVWGDDESICDTPDFLWRHSK